MTTVISLPLPASFFVGCCMGEVNLDRLRELAGHLRNACRELRTLAAPGAHAFFADQKTVNSAKYLFIGAAEAALDICNHLAAKKGGGARRIMRIAWRSSKKSASWARTSGYG